MKTCETITSTGSPNTAATGHPPNGLLTIAEQTRLENLLATRTRNTTSGCREWLGGSKSTAEQYGAIKFRRRCDRVHRVMVMLNGVPSPRLKEVVRHLCGNSRCVNPEHLRIGTSSENNSDTWSDGHQPPPVPLTEEDGEVIRRQSAMGHSSWRIAEEWFLCRSTVRRFMLRHRLGSYEKECEE